MKLLVDMNLSPSWVDRLARHGFEAVHWSTIGAATAPDVEILTWANEHVRPHHERPRLLGNPRGQRWRLAERRANPNSGPALRWGREHRRQRARRAPGGHRARRAPVDRRGRDARQSAASPPVPGSAVAPVSPDCHTAAFAFPGCRVWTRERGTGWGNRNSGAPFPLRATGFGCGSPRRALPS